MTRSLLRLPLYGLLLTLSCCVSPSLISVKPTQTPEPSDGVAPVSAPHANASSTDICQIFTVVHFDRLKDTLETIREVKLNNSVWHKLCDPVK